MEHSKLTSAKNHECHFIRILLLEFQEAIYKLLITLLVNHNLFM